MNSTSKKLRLATIVLSALGMFLFFFLKAPLPQDLSYHNFIDKRSLFGIPNAGDVLSNVFFLVVGILGVLEVTGQKTLVTKKSWFWFFLSILLVAPGSAYYHWEPNNQTLVWDRLPMSMGFMALYIALLSEHVNLKFEKLTHFALFVGVLSVITWAITDDLRFYFWVQFSSFITIPLILGLFPSYFTKKSYYSIALTFYALAKWTEIKDKEIFFGTGELMSGHSLKHILSAVGLMALWWMIKTRGPKENLAAATDGLVANSTR